MKIRYSDCHPDRKHKAKGLCRQCYDNVNRRANNNVKANCHPDRAHQAKGLCKPCYMGKYTKTYNRSIKSLNRRKENSWRRHGIAITTHEYNILLEKQGYSCAICKNRDNGGRNLAVDHDHDTGMTRGLLCDFCNRRLLIKRNTIEILKSAVIYLEYYTPAGKPA
jgi:hypothetical protein